MRIADDIRPGLADLGAEAYHAVPALSAGGAWTLIEECPAKFWHTSPFNPEAAAGDEASDLDFGTAAHLAILEPGRFEAAVRLVDAPDWRTKAAREARDEARAAGLTPLLSRHLAMIEAARLALRRHGVAAGAFRGEGMAEQSFFWRDEPTGVLCKARADFVAAQRGYMADLKTTASAHPRALAALSCRMGWHLRAAWYLDGWKSATGEALSNYWFVCVERDPPHLVTVAKLPDIAIAWGRKLARAAIDAFAGCVARGEFPGYRSPEAPDADRAIVLEMPGWAEAQLEARDEAGEFSPLPPGTPSAPPTRPVQKVPLMQRPGYDFRI